MKVFIMAAGEAERSFPYNKAIEKSMLPIQDGKPVVRVIVERLLRSGVCKPEEITICILDRHLKQFCHEFRDKEFEWLVVDHVPEPLGTAGHWYRAYIISLFAAVICSVKDALSLPVMVHYADSLIDLDYYQFMQDFYNNGRDFHLAITNNINHDYSQVRSVDGKVLEFIEKPPLMLPTWTGVAIFKPEAAFDISIEDDLRYAGQDFAKDVIPPLVKDRRVSCYIHNGTYVDLGTAQNYNKYRKKLDSDSNNR